MKIINNIALEETPIPGIKHQTLSSKSSGTEHLSVWAQTIEPNGATPPHRHDCEEVIIVTKGGGTLIVEGVESPFKAPCVLNVPRNSMHQIINSTTETVEVYAAFSVSPVEVYLPSQEKLELPWES